MGSAAADHADAPPSLSMRPTFDLDVPDSPEHAADTLAALIDRPDGDLTGQRAGTHLTLTVATPHRHFWSPWLHVELTPTESGQHTRLHGRFSPAPALWTAIMFTHLSLGVVAFFALMFAGAQLLLGATPHAAWVVLGCVIGAAALWWTSLVGQRLAYDQMHHLRAAVEHELGVVS